MTEIQTIDPELLAHATPAELAAYEASLIKQRALLSPLDYAIHVTDGRMKPYPHTDLLSHYAKAVIEHALYDDGIGLPAVWTPSEDDPDDGEWRHPTTGALAHNVLVVSAPPQHGKSAIMTETVPAWYLTKYPHNRVIVTGYEADFAKDFGRANRDKIENSPEFGVFVDKTTRAADNWKIQGKDGGLVTAGSGGPITGKRADLIIIDDPVKNQDEALSEASRRRNKNWWETTAKSRIRTDTVVILIQTRWHEDDLAGHIMATERCFSLNLPAIAFDSVDELLEEDHPDYGLSVDPDTNTIDPLRRKPGEVLCSALQTKSMLLRKQESGDGGDDPGGMLWFSALYQGKPNIEGGGILAKPYRYYEVKTNHSGKVYYRTKSIQHSVPRREVYAEECIYFITADLAVSTRNQADYTVFTLFAWTPYNQLLVIDMMRKRMESTEHAREAEMFWKKARTLTGGAGVRYFGVEHQTFGIALIQHLRRVARIPVKSLDADRDKIARAIPVGMMIREDAFFLPKYAPWLADLEKEMSVFPNGKHDDMVDTLGYGVQESTLLPRRDLSGPLSEPERAARSKKNRHRFHPQLGRMPGRR